MSWKVHLKKSSIRAIALVGVLTLTMVGAPKIALAENVTEQEAVSALTLSGNAIAEGLDESASENMVEEEQIEAETADVQVLYERTWYGCTYTLYDTGFLRITGTSTSEYLPSVFGMIPSDLRSSVTSASVATTNVVSIRGLFQNMYSLEKVSFAKMDSSKLEDMSDLFYGCEALTSVNFGQIHTEQVEDMSNMFFECFAIKTIDMSSFDYSKVSDFKYAFYRCESLETVVWGKADGSTLVNTACMFDYCDKIKKVSFPKDCKLKFATLDHMFRGCDELEEVDFGGVDLTNVTAAEGCFIWCNALNCVNFGNQKMSKVTEMTFMFEDCKKLKRLDLSGFDLSNMTSESQMYAFIRGCDALREFVTPVNGPGKVILPSNVDRYFVDENGNELTQVDVSGQTPVTCSAITNTTYLGIYNVGADLEYRPDGCMPDAIVRLRDTVLVKDVDYVLSAEKNKQVGEAVLIAKGINDYVFEQRARFYIVPADITKNTTVKLQAKLDEKGNLSGVIAAVTKDGFVLKEGTDYSLSFVKEGETGKGTITLTGLKNYSGSRTEHFDFSSVVSQQKTPLQENADAKKEVKQPSAKAKFVSVMDKKTKKKVRGIKISWGKVKNATGYDVYLGTKKKGTYKKVASVSGKKKSATIKKYGKKSIQKKAYYYYVVAKCKDGDVTVRSKVKKKYKLVYKKKK